MDMPSAEHSGGGCEVKSKCFAGDEMVTGFFSLHPCWHFSMPQFVQGLVTNGIEVCQEENLLSRCFQEKSYSDFMALFKMKKG